MSGWQPIETAPKDYVRIVLWPTPMLEKPFMVGFWSDTYACWYMQGVGHLNGKWNPTHWLKIPEPPNGEA